MADEEDRDQIILNDSLEIAEHVEGSTESSTSNHTAKTPLSGYTDDGVKYLGLFQLPRKDVKGARIVTGVGALVAVVAAVALGISYAVGAKQVKLTGLVTSDCAPCADMGTDILRNGGSAVDAIVTTVFCNGLVNMHSSGIGGGGFIMIRDHKNNLSTALDFRSSAPGAASADLYTHNSQLQYGSLAVAVPGEVAGLARAHKQHGSLEWKDLIKPVADLARSGFPITQSLSDAIDNGRSGLREYLQTDNGRLYNMLIDSTTGRSKPVGTLITREEYAEALDLIAEDSNNFYHSNISKDIENALNRSVTEDDLLAYRAKPAGVLRTSYQGYSVETVGPPAGGVILLHMLKILEGYHLTAADSDSDLMYHRMVEAMKFGFAAFGENIDFENDAEKRNFTDSLLREGHCAEIRDRITDNQTHNVEYYDPQFTFTSLTGASASTAIDENELFVTVTTTLGDHFGSGVSTQKYGIILNNCMGAFDYNFTAATPGLEFNENNTVKGGRRPRANMAPTVFYSNAIRCEKRGTVGGALGLQIIPATLQYLLDVLSFEKDSGTSMSRKRLAHHLLLSNNTLYHEDGFSSNIIKQLEARQHVNAVKDPLGVLSAGYKNAKLLYGHPDERNGGKTNIIQG